MDPKTGLKVAAALIGNTSDLCKRLGITRQALYKWHVHGIPLKRAIEIERLTEGKVKASDLCPGVWNASKSDDKKQSPSV